MISTTSKSKLILRPEDEAAIYEKNTGGKGSSLVDLVQQGFNVPNFFVITDDAYNIVAQLANLASFYPKLETLKQFQVRRISLLSESIQKAITSVQLPGDFCKTIFDAAKAQSQFNSFRSSMRGEDGVKLSYAGVLRTELFVELHNYTDVKNVYLKLLADAFSVSAINYRIQHGVSHDICLPIVVQEQINSYAGAVYFGQSQTSADESLISVCYGQCEGIVSNKITATRYKADNKSFKSTLLNAGPQETQMLPNFTAKTVEWIDIPKNQQTTEPLSHFTIQKIVELGQKEAARTGLSRDMEFSVTIDDGEEVLWVLQSRPVTKKIVSSLGPKDEVTTVLATGIATSPGIYCGKVSFLGSIPRNLSEDCIFVGPEFAPNHDWTLGSVKGILADTGDDASHASAKGHEFNIPVVLSAKNSDGIPISKLLKEGEIVTIDGYYGIIYRGVSQTRIDWSEEKPPQKTIDQTGLTTKLVVNCSYPENVLEAKKQGALGIGLLRGDFLWSKFPLSYIGGTEQAAVDEISQKLCDSAAPFYQMWSNTNGKNGQVVYRVFGPKLHEMREKAGSKPWHDTLLLDHRDPSAGIQGLSLSLHPEYIDAFILELRAFRKAWEIYPNLALMFPVVRSEDDCIELIEILTEVGLYVDHHRPLLYMMCELGINYTQPEAFLKYFDGASIGGNDSRLSLTLLNRDGSAAAYRYANNDPLLINTYCDFIKVCVRLGKYVSFCGNLPSSNPGICQQFVEAGITSISLGTHALPDAEKVVRKTENKSQ